MLALTHRHVHNVRSFSREDYLMDDAFVCDETN
jgi:hypothetical protein